MKTIAILCSGQGAQHPEMFDLFADCPAAEPVFAAATKLLRQDPRRVARASSAELFEDRIAQVLCCTQALAAWVALDEARPRHAVIAGYSVGELAAWGCAGALDAAATLRLAQRRAAVMDAAAPKNSGLAGVVGLKRAMLEPILARHGTHIAIINDVDSFVIGGLGDDLDASCRDAAACGATHTVRLRVVIPSHTPLLAPAVPEFRVALREATLGMPDAGYRLLSGIDGDTVWGIESGGDKLARQIATPVNWAACLESCRAAGATHALELGPGTSLGRMAARMFQEGHARATEEFRTLAGLRAWLARAGD